MHTILWDISKVKKEKHLILKMFNNWKKEKGTQP